MNERMRQLAYAAKLDGHMLWTSDNGNVLPYEMIKFAELIVRECADTVTDRCEMRNESDVKRAEYYAKRIKEHFGVEE